MTADDATRIGQLSAAKRALLERRLRERDAAAAAAAAAAEPGNADRAPVLSFAQERLWLLAELTPGLAAYNTTRVVRLDGRLDPDRLRAALAAVLERHHVLRTHIAPDAAGRPVATLAEVGAPALETATSPDEDTARPAIDAFANRPFDLAAEHALRALLVTVDDRYDLLVLSLHHIASDEASRSVVWTDLGAAYAGTPLPPLERQYADFARLQRAEFERPAMRAALDWWTRHLAGMPQVVDLPVDHQRPAAQTYRGARHRVELDPELAARLRAFGAARGATLFVTVLAAFQWLLRSWARSEDLPIGMLVSGRDRPETVGLIGMLVNTVVVRADSSGSPSFGELVDRARGAVLASLEHDAVPFDKVVEHVAPQRDVSRNPIFQVGVNAVTAEHGQEFDLGGHAARALDFDPGTTKFDLAMLVAERGTDCALVFEYSTDLFEPETVADLAAQVPELLRQAVGAPDVPLPDLHVLPADQRDRLVRDVNATDTPFPDACLHDLIAEQAARTPDATAVSDDETALTYRELDERANALAHRLVGLGVAPDVPVAVAVRRSVAMELAVLAVLKAGGAYVPLDSDYPAERLAYMLADCGAPVLLTETALVNDLPPHPRTVLVDELPPDHRIDPPVTGVTADNLAYVIYTSGSTGRPKGAELAHRGVVNRLDWMQRTFRLTAEDTVLQKTPLSFDVSVWEVLWPLITGARLHLARPEGHRDAGYLHDVIARERVSVLHFVPSMLATFLDHPRAGGTTAVRAVMCSGEALPFEVKERFFRIWPDAELHNLYGPTEASIDVTWAQCRPGPAHRVLIGAPISNVQVYVVDEAGRPVAVGVPGELYLAGVQLARGYLGRPDLTAERFVDFPLAPAGRAYRTGDLVRWTSSGELDYLGRIDGQVKLRGFRIELGEIESVLSAAELPGGGTVAQAAAVLTPAPSGDPLLAAYVVLDDAAGRAAGRSDDRDGDATGEAADAADHTFASDQVAEWHEVWEQTYGQPAGGVVDPYFDISGWASSFTGQRIPADEMAEWVAATVARIAGLGGRSVLEIGAGTGLLLWRLAPGVDRYVATDFAAAVTERLRALADSAGTVPGLTVRQLAADAVSADTVGTDFDTVVLNSVVQYFPDADYLSRVLDGVPALLAPGGRIFVGDVRDLRRHAAFAVRAELGAAPARSAAELGLRVEDRQLLDGELLLHPDFFAGRGAHVQVLPKRGSARNEMTGFRYDVVLHPGVEPVDLETWLHWDDVARDGWSSALVELERRLAGGERFGVLGIPDLRLDAVLAAERAVADGRLPGDAQPRPNSLDPEWLWQLAERLRRPVELSVRNDPWSIDVAFGDDAPVRFPSLDDAPASGRLANDPAAARRLTRRRAEAVTALDAATRERLPEYMVPTAIRVLPRLPLTPNGKLDRSGLPAPIERRALGSRRVAPATATEAQVAAVWAEVLGVRIDDLGTDDSFFRLGGHSLLAVRLVASLARTLEVTVPLRAVFETPTIAALAAEVDRQRMSGVAAALGPADRTGRRIRRADATDSSLAAAAAGRAAAVADADATVFPLSWAQERMWFLDRLEAGAPVYTVRRSMRLRGPLDVERLRRSLSALAERHDSLRTTVAEPGGVPVAVVADTGDLPLTTVDLTGEPDPLAAVRAHAQAAAATSFDLAAGPLATAWLYQVGTDDAVLVLRTHHLVLDGWSMDVVMDELAAAYAGGELDAPPLQYPDFAVWQRAVLDEAALTEQLDYWRTQLAGAPSTIALPTDRATAVDPGTDQSAGRRRSADLGAELTSAVRGLARESGSTPFAVLYAACTVLLARLAGDAGEPGEDTGDADGSASNSTGGDIVLGTAVAGRTRPEITRSVGLFANTLVLRTRLDGAPTFAEALRHASATVSAAQAHQDVPFERLVEELRPERELGRNPLFQVMINLQPPAQGSARLGDVVVDPFDVQAAFARFDLAFSFVERGDELSATIEYREALFTDAGIDALLERLRVLLAAACAEPTTPIADLPLVSAAERAQLLEQGRNATPAPVGTTPDLIAAQVAARPDAVAVSAAGHRPLTYAELWQRSGELAGWVADRAAPGSLVAIATGRHPGLVVATLAVWRAGCAYVPVDPSYPASRVEYMLAESGAALVLRDGDVLPLLADQERVAVPSLADAAPFHADQERVAVDIRRQPALDQREVVGGGSRRQPASDQRDVGPGNLAYVIYTSGSTGRPKGVAIEHRALANLLTSMAREPGLAADDTLLAVTTFSFDIAALELFLPLIVGGTVALADRDTAADPDALAAALQDATVVQATPSTYRMLLDAGWSGAPVRALCGGEALPPDLAARLLPRVRELWNCYGPTETTIWSTVERITDPQDVTVGRPIAGTTAYVLDRHRRLVPPGAQGELWLGGVGLARGYLNRPDLTAERFVPDPYRPGELIYRTGDVARWTADGRLRCLGRVDHQVKLRGHRIELGEIEAALQQLDGVGEAVAALRTDRPADARIVAYVVGRTDGVLDDLRRVLPGYMVPSAVVGLDAIPRTPNGKTDRAALPAPQHTEVAGRAPATPTEQRVAAVWAELLGLDAVGADDDFFAVGGHSLLATRVVARLADAVGVAVPLRAVFEQPTLAGLAGFIDTAAKVAGADTHPEPVSRDGRWLPLRLLDDPAELRAAADGKGSHEPGPATVTVFPAARSQQRMWLLNRMAPDDPAYLVPVLRAVDGPVDWPRLRSALGAVVDRHEILRTTYRQEVDLVQVVHPDLPADAVEVDARGMDDRELESAIRTHAQQPFDLTTGPALRLRLFRRGGTRGAEDRLDMLLLCAHHIALDGASIEQLLAELADEYAGRPVPAPPLQFGDYAVWDRARADGPERSADREWWRSTLAGAPPVTTIPTPYERKPGAVPGRRLRRALGTDASEAIDALARAVGVTPFMVLGTAVGALLERHAAGPDIVLGTPVSIRSFPGAERLLGALINTLVLRTEVPGDRPFRAVLAGTARRFTNAYAHADYPFDRLVTELDVPRDVRRHPVFQIGIGLQGAEGPLPALGGSVLRRVDMDWHTARFDLVLNFSRGAETGPTATPGTYTFTLEYRTDVVDDAFASWLADRFETLLRAAITAPDTLVGDLPVIGTAEQAALDGWNATEAPRAGDCVHERFAAHAAATPDRPAVGDERGWLTFGELDRRANGLAHELAARGVGPDERVAVYVERSVELQIALLAVLKAGGCYVALEPEYPAARIAELITDSGAVAVVTTAGMLGSAPAHPATVLVDRDGPEAAAPPDSGVTENNLVYIVYTSGSTGRPKGVAVEHRGVVNQLDWLRRTLGIGEADTLVHKTTLSFDASTHEVLLAPLAGAALVMARPGGHRDPVYIAELILEHRVTFAFFVPSMLDVFVRTPAARRCTSLRLVEFGGEPLPDATRLATLDALPGATVHGAYGPSEASIAVTHEVVRPDRPTLLGAPTDNVTVRIVDERGTERPVAVPGELVIGGIQVGRGYLGRPDLTARVFVDDVSGSERLRRYRSGDAARWLPDGRLEFLGRLDEQVKIRGNRVELGEVATVLRGLAGVAGAVPFAFEGALVGVVVPEPGTAFDPAAARHELRRLVPDHVVPTRWAVLDALPLLPNGKLDRAAAVAAVGNASVTGVDAARGVGDDTGYVAPDGPAEELVAELWQDLLAVAQVGATDNFFDIGGDSLAASRFVVALGALGIDLPLLEVFARPTVRELAEPVTDALLAGVGDPDDVAGDAPAGAGPVG